MLDLQDNHDGSHSFRELYEHRTALCMALVNSNKELFYKTKKNAENFSCVGWFLVMGELPSGQIIYPVHEKYWNSFKCKEIDKIPNFDGHSPHDIVKRIIDYAENYINVHDKEV